jgi:hypothetical protein
LKSPWVLLVVFVVAILAWLSSVLWVPELAQLLLRYTGKCVSLDISKPECGDVLSSLGATGDVFGAATSLFSGLALFAVAFTLWLEANSRRESRKPLVVTYLDSDSVVLDRAIHTPEPSLRLSVASKVANQTGEPALNVRVSMLLRSTGRTQQVPTRSLQLPLLSEGREESHSTVDLKGQVLQAMLASLTQDGEPISLDVTTTYDNLEGVRWTTSAVYLLQCKLGERRRRLNSFRSQTDDFAELWQNDAAVPLDVEVRADSWRHRRQ